MTRSRDIIDFWDENPCGAWHAQKKPVMSREYFEAISNFRHQTIHQDLDDFVRFNAWHNRRVLEVGCGIGSDSVEFMRHGAIYTGLDISSLSIEQAKQRARLFGLVGRFENRDAAADESYIDLGKFDLVYANGVIHHWPNLQGFIQNIWCALNPDGIFAFTVYATDSWDHVMSHYNLAQFEATAGCPYVVTFSRQQIEKFLDGFFEIENLTRKGCFMYNIASYRNKLLKMEPWFECMPAMMRQAIDTHYGKYYYVKARKVIK